MRRHRTISLLILIIFAFSNVFNCYNVQAYDKSVDKPIMCLEKIEEMKDGTKQYLNIKGWSINTSGVRQVKLYIDDSYIDELKSGQIRGDVYNLYKQYKDAVHSGFSGKVDITKNVAPGKRTIKIVSIGNDGISTSFTKTINITKAAPKVWTEKIEETREGTKQYLNIKGWSINASGVKDVNVYADDKYLGKLKSGQIRGDVQNLYSQYEESQNSGFIGKVDITKNVAPGKRTIKIVSIGNDGTSTSITKTVNITKVAPKVWAEKIEETREGTKQYLNVKGWSINASGVKEVKVYVGDKYTSTVTSGQIRGDVNRIYPNHEGSLYSGFSKKIDITKSVAPGKVTIKVVSIGNDGTSTSIIKTIDITKAAPKVWAESISEVKEGTKQYLNINGWSINASGVKEVNVYVDNEYLGKLATGKQRGDIYNAYPQYEDAVKAGFSGKVDITKNVAPGKRSIKVVSIGNDGSSISSTRTFNITKPAPKACLEKMDRLKENNIEYLNLKGWAVNASGLKGVKVYIDNNYVGSLTSGTSRGDVYNAYPQYEGSVNSGFNGKVNIPQNISPGQKNVKIVCEGNDGSQFIINRTIEIERKLIVIDPGHVGHDSGAVAHGKRESDLNYGVAIKLEKQLQSMGYKTYMTRSLLHPNQYANLSTHDELLQRTTAANNLKADLFISLHHDVAGSSSSGMWTFYSSWKPGIKNKQSDLRELTTGYDGNRDINPTKEAQLSKEFGQKVLNNLTSKCGYPTVRPYVVDRNLSVTVHTNMPSVLIELGMMSNKSELARCESTSGQQKKAQVIADTVKSMF